MGGMTRLLRLTALPFALAMAAAGFAATTAAADTDHPDFRHVDRWDATYELTDDGSVYAHVEIDFDFAGEPGHGIYLNLPTTQPVDDELERVWDITGPWVYSPTGAPDLVDTQESDGWLSIRIGDPGIGDVSGVQTYVIEYAVAHVMNATTADETDAGVAGDEFYWNVIGSAWDTPISDIHVVVTADPNVLDAACFAGYEGSNEPCASLGVDGSTAEFTIDALDPHEPATVAVLYPEGTFDTTANVRVADDFQRAFALTPWTVGGAILLLGGGIALLVRQLRRTAFDVEYADEVPGLAPAPGASGATRRRRKRAVTVQFEPPEGLRPGQLGTLIDEKADVRDVTATIVDQAVRGFLRIDPVGEPDKPGDYRLVRLRDADGSMPAYGRTLFEAIFDGRDELLLSDLKTTFAADLAKVQAEMYRDVTDRGWFRRNPNTARLTWAGLSMAALVGAVLATVFIAVSTSAALLGVALVVVAIVALCMSPVAPARTAEGTRILHQTEGFRLYLTTADANQLRFEEGQDIFSRYLPFAIAFGVADKWSKVFEQLAREGHDVPAPSWYGGMYAPALFWTSAHSFGSQMQDFTHTVDTAISAPTPGSSGGSGFSSGGGFSGGGSFGGGGGGW